MKHIELIGTAGVGKSTVHQMLIDMLPTAIDPNNKYQRIRAILTDADSFHCGISELINQTVNEITSDSVQRVAADCYQFYAQYPNAAMSFERCLDCIDTDCYNIGSIKNDFIKKCYRFEDSSRINKKIVIDEGFAMTGLSLVSRTLPNQIDEEINYYIESTPNPDLLIHITADVDVCLERLHTRRRGPPGSIKNRSKRTQLQLLRRGKRAGNIIADRYDKKEAMVIKLNNNYALEDTIEDLIHELSKRGFSCTNPLATRS